MYNLLQTNVSYDEVCPDPLYLVVIILSLFLSPSLSLFLSPSLSQSLSLSLPPQSTTSKYTFQLNKHDLLAPDFAGLN